MTTLRFNAPDGFKREFLEDGTIKATCNYCGEVMLGMVNTRTTAETQHRLGCASSTSGPEGADTDKGHGRS